MQDGKGGKTHSSVSETSPCRRALSSSSTSRLRPSCKRTGFVSARRGRIVGCPRLPEGARALLLLLLWRFRRRRELREPAEDAPEDAESSSCEEGRGASQKNNDTTFGAVPLSEHDTTKKRGGGKPDCLPGAEGQRGVDLYSAAATCCRDGARLEGWAWEQPLA